MWEATFNSMIKIQLMGAILLNVALVEFRNEKLSSEQPYRQRGFYVVFFSI